MKTETISTLLALPDRSIYETPRLTVRGYTGKRGTKHSCLSSLANTRIMRAAFPDYKRADHARRAMELRTLAHDAATEHGALWEYAFNERFGRPPDFWEFRISGVGNDQLSEDAKTVLRYLAVLKGVAASLAHLHEQVAGVAAMRQAARVTVTKYKVSVSGDRWKRFNTQDEALAYEAARRAKDGVFRAVEAYQVRA